MLRPLLFLALFGWGALLSACDAPGQVTGDGALDDATRALIAEKRAHGLEPNRLITEKSPYLLQHAFNPVDWYPWGDEAFEKAHRENKPIFLSVGYSTCYWCHVMERDVFESDSLAAVMNEYVVSIKVDREERPDIDHVYMTALQAMSGGGGWPMSMFLTPDRKPFFGATYIPPDARNGGLGFGQIVRRLYEAWMQQRDQVEAQADQITAYVQQVSAPQAEPTTVGSEVLDAAFAAYTQAYDSTYGGFGAAPKFPRPASLEFLFSYAERTGDEHALSMALTTLRQMARGGVYDHIGEGFHRYSTDAQWRVPHFEKMLYDQAQLVNTYLRAYQQTQDATFADVARRVLAYVDRMMRHPEGGFYSAEDAESAFDASAPDEKEEGVFYLWTKADLDALAGPQAAEVFAYVYGVEASGNALQDPQQVFVGTNILYEAHTVGETAAHMGLAEATVSSLLDDTRATLFATREERPSPHLDDKILASWNGMMISAYANAFAVLGEAHYRETAATSAAFILDVLSDPATGRLKRRYRQGEARYEATLADYAFLVHGLLDLHEATDEKQWLDHAVRLTDTQITLFFDEAQGGFFDTTGEDASLLIRSKESYDGAEPSGNAVALLNLVRLSAITGNEGYRQKAVQSAAYFGTSMQQRPSAMPLMLVALDRLLGLDPP